MSNNYRYLRHLGQGGFGKTYLCQDRNNKTVCIKVIEITEAIYKSIKREVYILSQLAHPRIIQFIDYITSSNSIQIVMEYAPNHSLRDFINQQNRLLATDRLLYIFSDIVMGLEYLHIKHVIHGDLKPENLLLSRNYRIKICDFGISTVREGGSRNGGFAGTAYYLAPEMFLGKGSDFQTDIWALGCIFYELCTFKKLFASVNKLSEIKDILLKCRSPFWPCNNLPYNDDVKNLCRGMLTISPQKRITLPEIIGKDIITPNFYHLYFDYYYVDSL